MCWPALPLHTIDHTIIQMPDTSKTKNKPSCCDRAEKIAKNVFGGLVFFVGIGVIGIGIAAKEATTPSWQPIVLYIIGGIVTVAGLYIMFTNPFSRFEKEISQLKKLTLSIATDTNTLNETESRVRTDVHELETVVTTVKHTTETVTSDLEAAHTSLASDLQFEQSLDTALGSAVTALKEIIDQSNAGKVAITTSAKSAKKLAAKIMKDQTGLTNAQKEILSKLGFVQANSAEVKKLITAFTTQIASLSGENVQLHARVAELQTQVTTEQGLLTQEQGVTDSVDHLIAGLKAQNDRLELNTQKKAS